MSPRNHQHECSYPRCLAVFGTRYNLKRHVEARHLRIKKFSCEICGARLASKQTKTEHMYTHTGEKPYRCPYEGCGQWFRQSSQLSVHVKQHLAASYGLAVALPPISESRRRQQEGIKLPVPPFLYL